MAIFDPSSKNPPFGDVHNIWWTFGKHHHPLRVDVVYGCPLDIGANLGYFSLIASSLHHKSIAVEAVASNVYRIREAVWRSNLSMDIYRYAIGEAQSRTSYLFQGDLSTGNRGHGQVEKIIRDYPVHPNSLPVHFRSTSGSLLVHLVP